MVAAASFIAFIPNMKFSEPGADKIRILEHMAERCFCAIYNNREVSISTIQILSIVESHPTQVTEK